MSPALDRPLRTLRLAVVAAATAGGCATVLLLAPARADEPPPPAPATRIVCRLFDRDLDKDRQVDTSDRLSEIGRWVGTQEAEGFAVLAVDFATAQKPTGYPQGWLNVCVSR